MPLGRRGDVARKFIYMLKTPEDVDDFLLENEPYEGLADGRRYYVMCLKCGARSVFGAATSVYSFSKRHMPLRVVVVIPARRKRIIRRL